MAAPVAPNLGTRIILNTRFIIAPPDTLYITNFILSMGYSICIPMMLVRLIMTMTGALRYSTGIESRYSVPQNIMVIGLARITSMCQQVPKSWEETEPTQRLTILI